jgi:hypothetical protein
MNCFYIKRRFLARWTTLPISILVIFFLPFIVNAATLYVSENGTRTSGASTPGDWSNSNCYSTIGVAIDRMSGGDEVVVNDGIYTGINNAIGRRNGTNIPSGTASEYTVIRARNPFKVTIDSGISGEWDYYGRMIYIAGQQYIKIDGFKGINQDGSNNAFVTIAGSYIKVTRCMFRTARADNRENEVFQIYGSSTHHILVEDCALTGGYRYGFIVQGIGSSPHQIIWRRCVIRLDWSDSDEPISGFAIYGHNASAASGPYDILYQNCIAIDSNPSVPDATWKAYQPWYIFKGNHDIILRGCITLNNDQTGSSSGSWIRNDYGGSDIDVLNCIFWGYTGPGQVFGGDDLLVDGCTFGNNSGNSCIAYSSPDPCRNTLFYDNGSGVGSGFSSASYNSFYKDSSFGSNVVSYQNDLDYIVRVESSSNRYTGGLNGVKVGAHIVNKIGASGTLWGEPGWNDEQQNSLWPWPYENEIRDWFRTTNNPPSGARPSKNNTQRGFCAGSWTLTKYIWEYLGNPIPPEIYGGEGTPPSAPVNLRIKQ